MIFLKGSISYLLLLLIISPLLNAQNTETPSNRYLDVSAGLSSNSVVLLAKTPDTETTIAYVGFGKLLWQNSSNLETYLTRGIIPYIEYVYPQRDQDNQIATVTGFGISPLGYHFKYKLQDFAFFGAISTGVFLVSDRFPTRKGRRLNYAFDLSVGAEMPFLPKTSLSFGYKFHHISNAQTGAHNPGVDSNFLFLSLKQFIDVN